MFSRNRHRKPGPPPRADHGEPLHSDLRIDAGRLCVSGLHVSPGKSLVPARVLLEARAQQVEQFVAVLGLHDARGATSRGLLELQAPADELHLELQAGDGPAGPGGVETAAVSA